MNDMEKIMRINGFIQHTRMGGKLYLDGKEVSSVALDHSVQFIDYTEEVLSDEQLEELLGQTYGKPPYEKV